MKNRTKSKIISQNWFKSAVFFIAVVAFCALYYFVSPFFISEKPSSVSDFPIYTNAEEITDMEVHFINVGQADSALIKTPDCKYILIDGGDADETFAIKFVSYLEDLGVKTIDYAVATHPDADHIGGFRRIFDKFKVKFVFRPYVKSSNAKTDRLKERFNPPKAYYCDTDAYADFLLSLKKERSSWVFSTKDTDVTIDYGKNKLIIDFLTPEDDLENQKYYDMNEYSPLIKISYGKFSFMFTGDASSKTEKEALDLYDVKTIRANVLKVGHHGSDTSTSFEFLKGVSPEYAVISCGDGNIYKHPKQTVLNNLLARNVRLFRTDKQGNVVFYVDDSGKVKVSTEITYNGSLYSGY